MNGKHGDYDDAELANESQCNINETNESFTERRHQANIPSL